MRIITDIKPLNDFRLECVFNNGEKKIASIKPFLKSEVFKPLNDPKVFFSTIYNGGYYIVWKDYEIDLSADTLWHIADK